MSLATGADALAKSGDSSTTTQAKASGKSDADDKSTTSTTDYALSIASWGYNNDDPSLIDVTFGAEFRTNINNMDFCWTDNINDINVPCWDNKVDVTNGDGELVWGWYIYTVDVSWIGIETKYWEGSLDMSTGMFTGYEDGGDWNEATHEPIECGTAYKFKLRNGIWYDTLNVTFPCQEVEEEEEEEACTECPYGGYYDGAHCKVGVAPYGTTALIYNDWYAYTSNTSTSTKCPSGTSLKNGACGIGETPDDTESFVWNNAWYYHPVCD